jgi:hypothetical protein
MLDCSIAECEFVRRTGDFLVRQIQVGNGAPLGFDFVRDLCILPRSVRSTILFLSSSIIAKKKLARRLLL